MDEQPIPVPPSTQTATQLTFFSKNKRLLIGILIFIVVLSLIIISMIMYKKYINTTKFPNKISQTLSTPTPTSPPVILSSAYQPSKDLITNNGITFFAGKVIEKTNTSLTIQGDGKTLKFTVSGNIYFMEMPKILTVSVQDYIRKQPLNINYQSIKNGDLVSVSVELVNKAPVVIGGLIFK